jgi:Pyruvate/2-oxoacid:ferredoxin oxidoreductase delta subunit
MKPTLFNRKSTRTSHVQLDTRKCKACWRCLEDCQKQVIGKVNLPWHKHALIINSDKCTGCLRCINACPHDAFSMVKITDKEVEGKRSSRLTNFIVNNLLLSSGILVILSGLILQLGFHAGGAGRHQEGVHGVSSQSVQYEQLRGIDTDKMVYGLSYHNWSASHKLAITLFSLLMIFHIHAHWKWYRAAIRKRLIRKNIQVIILSALFLAATATGIVPWLIDLSGSTSTLRWILIEIHDKLALILIVFLILHVSRRTKWFTSTYANSKKQP